MDQFIRNWATKIAQLQEFAKSPWQAFGEARKPLKPSNRRFFITKASPYLRCSGLALGFTGIRSDQIGNV
jgi:hypothetical protein